MINHNFIIVEKKESILWITLARPDLRNAFNDEMIAELHKTFNSASGDTDLRAIVINAQGKAFCAGADLTWMKKVIEYDFEHNYADSMALADMLWTLQQLDLPSIALVHGPAVGGGVGLVAACDFAIASENAWFKLSEVKLGIAPAVISPFLYGKIGSRHCRDLFLTGRKFTATTAKEIGLINYVSTVETLSGVLEELLADLLTSAPGAIAACKKLLTNIPNLDIGQTKEFTAKMIAKLRIGNEGQEGMKSFLNKTKPSWMK